MHPHSRAGIGHSKNVDAFTAGSEAAASALRQINGLPPVIAIAHATVLYDQVAFLRGVRSVLPDTTVVGGSVPGLSLTGAADLTDRVVGVALLGSHTITARAACVSGIGANAEEAGAQLARALPPSEHPLIIWYDPLTGVNAERFLEVISQGGHQLIGGATGQTLGVYHKTFQYYNDEVLNDSAIVLQLSGCSLITDLTHGMETIGLDMIVTASEGVQILEIDDQPAAEAFYNLSTLEEGAQFDISEIAEYAIGLPLPDGLQDLYEGPLTRGVFGIDPQSGALTLQVPVPPGSVIQLCHRTHRAVVDRALQMARRVRPQLDGRRPVLALSFECAARSFAFLGPEQSAEEVRQMQQILGPTIPWLGMYAFGEVAPVGDRTFFHNNIYPLCVICE